ncbi:MAG: transposase [Deltaproteobacteria bacterium]|nr:transposase [Deltaproteobacteria bacterium]MBW2086780.1 transposase [Deltaproteobacteria bacterium]
MSDRKIYDEEGHAHYLTFSCYRRRRILNDGIYKKIVIGLLASELAKQNGEYLGFVVMPDHVHVITCFSMPNQISSFMKVWKQRSSRYIKKNMRENHSS